MEQKEWCERASRKDGRKGHFQRQWPRRECWVTTLLDACKISKMGKELRENAPAARGSKEAGLMKFLTNKSTLLGI